MEISYSTFTSVNLRSGTIVKAQAFPRARNPSYKVWVDFGPEYGVLQTSAQITQNYALDDLIGLQVIGCLNLGDKNIAGFTSEFLLLGFSDESGHISLASSMLKVPNGQKLH